jgi:hypothetical protein
MSVTQKLVTSSFNVATAANFIDSFADNDYFVYAARHIPYTGSDTNIPVPNNSVASTDTDVYDNMIFAKRVTSNDVIPMAKKNLWTADTFYDMYDHIDGDLENKNFFIVVDDDTEYNVWKCLFNNSTALTTVNSTVAPSRVGSAADLNPVETGDGYVWKYMYTITKTQYEKFATSLYIPVVANNDVIAGATRGTIEVIKVENAGARYDNYIASGTFLSADVTVGGIPTFYGAPATAVSIDDYYQGCVLKITSGAATGEYRRIVNYEGTSAQKKFILDASFIITPEAGDSYEVYPYAFVWGDGEESTPAEGIVYIDSTASNSINRVELLDVGENYRKAEGYVSEQPITIPPSIFDETYIQLPSVISSAVGFVPASLRPIISPKNGHGSDPYNELFAKRVCLSAKFNNSESGIIPTENDFRQVGLIKNPLFTEVDMNITNTTGPGFAFGEKVLQYRKLKLHGNVSINADSTTIEKTNFGLLSTSATIVNGGIGYNSTANNQLVFNDAGTGGSGATGTFANNGSGVITAVTITPGTNYVTAPTITVSPEAGGSNGVITVALANPDTPAYQDAFAVGDYVLVTDGLDNYISTVAGVPQDYRITTANTQSSFTADDCEISAIIVEASGIVSFSSTSQIELSNVAGVFTSGSRIIGVGGMSGDTVIPVSGTTAEITGIIEINDRNASSFNYSRQLTQLIGTFSTGGVPFIEDEEITQESLIGYAKPRGKVHHADIYNDNNEDYTGSNRLWISNRYGIFNLDARGVRDIAGEVSSAELSPLLNKYNGDFVVGSGDVLYVENLDPITRNDNKSEIIKIVLEF